MKHPADGKNASSANAPADPDDAELLGNALMFAMSEELDKVRAYVERGRRFAHMDTATLKDAWVETLGKLAPDPIDLTFRLALDDTAAELQLRGEDLPAERAQAEIEAFARSIDALVTDGIKADPDAWNCYGVELTEDIRRFMQQKKRAN